MKRALIITGGEYAPYEFVQYYLPAYDLLIAADSGLDTALQFGLVPDFVIGDMDSVKDNLFIQACDKTRTHLFPRDKDFTDTELAVTLAHQLGSDDLSIVGGGGGRADHFFIFHASFLPHLCHRVCGCTDMDWDIALGKDVLHNSYVLEEWIILLFLSFPLEMLQTIRSPLKDCIGPSMGCRGTLM